LSVREADTNKGDNMSLRHMVTSRFGETIVALVQRLPDPFAPGDGAGLSYSVDVYTPDGWLRGVRGCHASHGEARSAYEEVVGAIRHRA